MLTLQEAIVVAQTQSPDFQKASYQKEIARWQYQLYQSGMKPNLSLSLTLPNFSRTIEPIIQNDGSEIFRERSLASSQAFLSLEQQLPTGGTFFASSQLSRLDILGNSRSTSFLSYPVLLGFRQPIFGFNTLKWNRKLEPLKLQESVQQYNENLEIIAVNVVNLFFNTLLFQYDYATSLSEYQNNDTLFKVSVERYKLGQISETELLQAELNKLNAQTKLAITKTDYQKTLTQLKFYLKIPATDSLQLEPPLTFPLRTIDDSLALQQARRNKPQIIQLRKKLLEAEKEVALARANAGLSMNLALSFGFSKSAPTLSDVYAQPQDQQNVRLGIEIPLLDWGKGKAGVEIAQIKQSLARTEVRVLEQNFEQELIDQIARYRSFREQISISEKALQIAEKQYQVTNYQYRRGNIGLLELSQVTFGKQQAQKGYLSSLQNFWASYYQIRSLTLYDFEKDQPLYSE